MMLTTPQIIKIFGQPGDDRNLVTVKMPYDRRIDFLPNLPITKRMQCHTLVAPIFQKIHTEILDYYGFQRLKELEIDLFGGGYNFRKMRGGNDWSRHSWGIAEDLSTKKNTLNMGAKKAQFAKHEYKALMECYYDNGFCNQGVEKGFDYMHFEFLKFM